MASSVAWVDTSAEEQRRVREMIALFAEHESRDELGIGQIRDALSDSLFPGTSTLQTRARYFLLVPWAYEYAQRKGGAKDLGRRARDVERSLVPVLQRSGSEGVIGGRAGARVKNLPSALYWSGLRAYGVLLAEPGSEPTATIVASDADELVQRRTGAWHPIVPPPAGFPDQLDGGLTLRPPEARWLRERIVETSRDTLLEHLVLSATPPDETSDAPWHDSVASGAPEPAVSVLRHAQQFSLAIRGAALLYNVLIAERYEAAGHDRVENAVEVRSSAYSHWLNDIEAQHHLRDWDVLAFWQLVGQRTTRVSYLTRTFVNSWIDSVRSGAVDGALAVGDPLRSLVGDRERSIKGGQSRLKNPRLLAAWPGASGTGQLTFRWQQVRRIVADIVSQLEGDENA